MLHDEDEVHGGNAMSDDADDPVIHEIPVFLSKTLADKLYVFQVSRQRVERGPMT